jgi:DNA-binding beta-propeller fold protein YncE
LEDQQFDALSRRVGELTSPALPRRGLLRLASLGALAGTLGVAGLAIEPAAAKQNKNKDKNKNSQKCKKEDQKCDKKQCKKKGKKCCCHDLKCKNDRCQGKGPTCRTDAQFDEAWTSFDSGPGPDSFNFPWGVATDPDGNVYVTDSNNERVLIFDAGGSLIDEFGTEGNDDDEFQEPRGIGFNRDDDGNDRILVLDPGQSNTSRMFRKFRDTGQTVNNGNLGLSTLTNPNGITVDENDRIWVVDAADGQVFRFNTFGENPGTFSPSGNGDLNGPLGIAVVFDDDDDATYVYVADSNNDRIVKFEFVNNSTLAFRLDSRNVAHNADFNHPIGLAVDTCGNVWVADRLNNRIQILDKNLEFVDRFTAGFSRPTGVAFSPNGKTLYVADSENNRVVTFNLS